MKIGLLIVVLLGGCQQVGSTKHDAGVVPSSPAADGGRVREDAPQTLAIIDSWDASPVLAQDSWATLDTSPADAGMSTVDGNVPLNPALPPPGCKTALCIWRVMAPCYPKETEGCKYENHDSEFATSLCFSSGVRRTMFNLDERFSQYWPDGSLCYEYARRNDLPGVVYEVRDGAGRLAAVVRQANEEASIREIECDGQKIRSEGLLCLRPPTDCKEGRCPL